jgi:pimeloyl-ACP methyl ester carboxylesterase
MLSLGMGVGPRRNGVYGGWTHAGSARVFVRVPTELKELSDAWNWFGGNGMGPQLDVTPIVLVHGLSSGRALKPLIRALGSRRPVYAPDLPGFGLSDQPIHPLDVPGLADALRRWLLENQLAPAIVIGVSFGSQVAVDLAARHPAAVDRLVLVGPVDPDARTPGRLALRWARNAPRFSPRLAPTVVHDFIDAGPWRAARTLRRTLDDRIEEKLGEIEAPTLVVRPERDHLVPENWTKRVAKLIPDSEVVVLPKAGHSIGPRTASRLTALLVPFLVEMESEQAGEPVEEARRDAEEPEQAAEAAAG